MVANAGIAQVKPALELTESDIRKMFEVNVFGLFNCYQVAAKHMIAQKEGCWAAQGANNTGAYPSLASSDSLFSVAGHQANAGLIHYGGSKFAVRGITQGMAKEMAPHGIRVNSYCPGIINTQMQDDLDASRSKTSGRALGASIAKDVEERVALKEYGTPEDVAKVVAFLTREESAYVSPLSVTRR